MSPTLFTTRIIARAAPRTAQFPVLDFLAPSTVAFRTTQNSRLRFHSAAPTSATATATASSTAHSGPPPAPRPQPHSSPKTTNTTHTNHATPPRAPLTPSQQTFLDSALRVNQAGELAAVLIYTAQTPPLIRSHPHLRPLMAHMHSQEASHFSYFNTLLSKHRVRPTLMYPIWHAAASALGWSTAVLGREAAMACTEAVETEIGGHYNEQVRVLLDWAEKLEARGEGVGEEMGAMIGELRRIRDEELEHLDHAVENDSKEAKPYELLTNVIRGGCRTAIWISEKV